MTLILNGPRHYCGSLDQWIAYDHGVNELYLRSFSQWVQKSPTPKLTFTYFSGFRIHSWDRHTQQHVKSSRTQDQLNFLKLLRVILSKGIWGMLTQGSAFCVFRVCCPQGFLNMVDVSKNKTWKYAKDSYVIKDEDNATLLNHIESYNL